MRGRVLHFHTQVTRALVDDQRARLEHSLQLLVRRIEVLEGDVVAQQLVEVAGQIQQLPQVAVFRRTLSQRSCIGIVGSSRTSLKISYLRTHLFPFLLLDTRNGSLRIDGGQTDLLQPFLLEVLAIGSLGLLVRSDDICSIRSLRKRLSVNGHSSDSGLYVGQRHLVLVACDLFRDTEDSLVLDLIQLQHILARQQRVRSLQHLAQPLACSDDLIHFHVFIAIQIQQLQCCLIHLESLCRATQDSPHLLVQLAQMTKILTRTQLHARVPTYRGELPIILLFHIYVCCY